MKNKLLISILFFSLTATSYTAVGQAHNVSAGYEKPTDPLVLANLEDWQDMKFGLFMHWGTYSQWGIVESWSLCPEDEEWTQRKAAHGESYNEYVKNYENLQKTFNPTASIQKSGHKLQKLQG